MAEYIDRQAALEECDWYANEFCECEYAIMPLKGALENIPAADVRPAVKARWEKVMEQPYFRKHYHVVTCSACHKRGHQGWNFCPNCGAMMEES